MVACASPPARGWWRSVIILVATLCLPGSYASIQSVPDLIEKMSPTINGDPCVKLLNATGQIGCSSKGAVAGTLERVTDPAQPLPEPRVVLLAPALLAPFLHSLDATSARAARVVAVLVEDARAAPPAAFSPAATFPQAALAPYDDKAYAWNPPGSSISLNRYPFPILALDAASTALVRGRAEHNRQRAFQFPHYQAELKYPMWADQDADSFACLEGRNCLPLGGYSVWAALPPFNLPPRVNISVPEAALNPNSPRQDSLAQDAVERHNTAAVQMQWTLVTAQMDTASLFHDQAAGADAPLSGLLTMLAAAELLSTWLAVWTGPVHRRIVFAAFGGEPWGYLGSRRFLHGLRTEDSSVAPLSLTNLASIVELGQVGFAGQPGGGEGPALYLHADRLQNATVSAHLLEILRLGANGTAATVDLADPSTPGVPPSSMMSFLGAGLRGVGGRPRFPHAVLTEFDREFASRYHWSRYDTAARGLDLARMARAAVTVARALYSLATAAHPPPPSPPALASALRLLNATQDCLLGGEAGLGCALAAELMTASASGPPSHYVGVLRGLPRHLQAAGDKSDVARFVWNFLANRTGVLLRPPPAPPADAAPTEGEEGAADEEAAPDDRVLCSSQSQCHDMQGVCVGITRHSKGWCVNATVKYTLALSPHLNSTRSGRWSVNRSGVEADGEPLLTESYWPSEMGASVFLRDSGRREWAVLAGGVCLTAASALGAVLASQVYAARTKLA